MSPEADPITLTDIIRWLASALGAVALWVARMFHKRLDQHEGNYTDLVRQVREIDATMVTRDTFHRHEVDVYGRLDEMRKDATGREDRIVAAFKEEFRDLRNRLDKVLDERPQR